MTGALFILHGSIRVDYSNSYLKKNKHVTHEKARNGKNVTQWQNALKRYYMST